MLFSFVMNHCFTFRGFNGGPLLSAFFRFLFVTIGLLIVVQFVQHGIIENTRFPELVGVICGMFVYTRVGFALNRLWAFDDQKLIRCSQPD
jgi:putative flippase GtrA